jgi:hypothetical protein
MGLCHDGDRHPGGGDGRKGMLFLAGEIVPKSGGGGAEAKRGTGLLPPACLANVPHANPPLRETYPSHMSKSYMRR